MNTSIELFYLKYINSKLDFRRSYYQSKIYWFRHSGGGRNPDRLQD